jgi:hypothetical protein
MLPALNIRAAVTPHTVNRFFNFIEFSSRGWIFYFAWSRDNTRALSIDCESNQAGAVPARNTAVFRQTRKPAAQLVLALPSRLRSFCAAPVKKVREHLPPAAGSGTKSGSALHF